MASHLRLQPEQAEAPVSAKANTTEKVNGIIVL